MRKKDLVGAEVEEEIQDQMGVVGLVVTQVSVHHLQTPTQWQQLIQMSRPRVAQRQQHLEWLEVARLFKLRNTTLRPHQTTRPTIKTKTSSSGNITGFIQLKKHKPRCIVKSGMGGRHKQQHKAIILHMSGESPELHNRELM
jgi:hypothetical protein